jgi:Ras-related protein Rab-21
MMGYLFIRKENSIISTDHFPCSFDSYANSLGAKHFHISAKWNHAIEEMFYELSERMVELAEESSQQNASSVGQSGSTQSNVVVKDDEAVAQSKSGCCGGVSSAF